jgi:hypothetical protein
MPKRGASTQKYMRKRRITRSSLLHDDILDEQHPGRHIDCPFHPRCPISTIAQTDYETEMLSMRLAGMRSTVAKRDYGCGL